MSCNCGPTLHRLEEALKALDNNYAWFSAPNRGYSGLEKKQGAEGEIKSRIDLINRKYEQECIRQQDHADPKARSGAWDVVDATEV
jgi:hypothetical protein